MLQGTPQVVGGDTTSMSGRVLQTCSTTVLRHSRSSAPRRSSPTHLRLQRRTIRAGDPEVARAALDAGPPRLDAVALASDLLREVMSLPWPSESFTRWV